MPKEIQTLMRHSSIVMSMDIYGHLFPGLAAQTIHCLPDMDEDEPTALRATDTYDTEPADYQQYSPQWLRETVQHGANTSSATGSGSSEKAGKPKLQAIEHEHGQTVGAPPVV